MPSESHHCRYCHQIKPTRTALNRHIAHSPTCFQAWQHDLLKLTSTKVGENAITLDDLMPSTLGDGSDDSDIEMANPDETFLPPDDLPSRPNANIPQARQQSVEIEDVEDVDDPRSQSQYRVRYPGRVAEILGEGKTCFEEWYETQRLNGENTWAPFDNHEEWELAQWLIRNVGQKSIDEYLKLPIVSL